MVRRSRGMKKPAKLRAPVLAAGGIVVREGPEPLIAVVRLRKDKSWVLPKGKLKPREDALAGARREVMEETGCDVAVERFLRSMSHVEGKKLKVVQFWRMWAASEPARKLMDDVTAVKWLPLQQAVGRSCTVSTRAREAEWELGTFATDKYRSSLTTSRN